MNRAKVVNVAWAAAYIALVVVIVGTVAAAVAFYLHRMGIL